MRRLLAALFVALFAFSAAAAPLPSIKWRDRGTASVTAYDPGGVLFWQEAGATYTTAPNANLNGGADTSHGIVCFRRKLWLGTPTVQGPGNNFRSSANFGTFGDGTGSTEGSIGYMINADSASWTTAPKNGTGFTLRNTLVPQGASQGVSANPTTSTQGLGYAFDFQWQSACNIYDTNLAANSRINRTWVDGTLLITTNTDVGAAFTVGWNTSNGMCIADCNRNSGIPTGGALELADIIVDTTNALPAGCPATPTACTNIINAFYRYGGPVNPGSDGVKCDLFRASYSGASKTDYCMRGDKDHILLNTDGTAQPMVVTNSVSGTPRTTGNGGSVLYNSAYGQGAEPTDRPYIVWAAPMSTNTVSTSTTASCFSAKCESNVMGNFGGSIKKNDRLLAFWSNCYNSTTPSATLPTLSAGWSFVASSTTANPSDDVGANQRCQWAVATHVATQDYISVNNPWVTGNPFVDPPTITYTSTGTAPLQVSWVLADYRSQNGVVNIDISDFVSRNQTAGASASLVTPSVTTTKTVETLVSVCMSKSSARPTNPPAGEDIRHVSVYSVSALPIITVADEKLSVSGATGTRTYTIFGTTSTNERAYCGLIALANN